MQFAGYVLVLVLAGCHQNGANTQTAEKAEAVVKENSRPVEESAQAEVRTPVTTKHYSLTLPQDWVVLSGPVKERETVRFQLANKSHSATVAIIVGPARQGDAEQIAQRSAQRLQTKAVNQNGQWQFVFQHGQDKGVGIVREDPANSLLLLLTVSGDVAQADFIYDMRTPYPALKPVKVQ